MPRVRLEDLPATPDELEEYVAALFQASGYFVEKNVIERDASTILELDVVATRYDTETPTAVFAEAKSGDWGFADLFKVLGWMRYLGIEKSAFFATRRLDDKPPALINRKLGAHGIEFVCVDDPEDAIEQFRSRGFGQPIDDIAIGMWRLFFWLERHFLVTLRDARKQSQYAHGPAAALQYLEVVNNEIWFESDVRRRLWTLYREFVQHPKISLGIAREANNEPYDAESPNPTHPVVREAIFQGKHPVVQASLWVDHRARLALLKAAVDYLCLEAAGQLPSDTGRIEFRHVMMELLPAGVQAGLQRLREQPNFRRYALFWQVFLWSWGGFYLKDRQDQEFAWLSAQTGVPVEEIPSALELFDILFPTPGGWLTESGPSQCRLVKMVPMPVQGIGAVHRLTRYGVKHYDELGYSDYTARDLARWHNSFVDALGREDDA